MAAVPVAVTWWLSETPAAQSLYRGMTFMIAAVAQLSVSRQLVAGCAAGAAALAGVLAAGSLPLGLAAVVVACLLQAGFNMWSTGVAALLPSVVVSYAFSVPVWSVPAAATVWLGAGLAILAATAMRMGGPSRPTPSRAAVTHAFALAAGCVALVLLQDSVGLPHGGWAVLTFCLVFVPASHETARRVRQRVAGTLVGAVLAAAVAVEAPPVVCLVLAAGCAVMAVAYALTPEADLQYVIFLTPTVILLHGASHYGTEVLGLTAERVGLTAVGGLLALVLTKLFLHRPSAVPES
ncbi:FUSC family protein [Streptomyces sp. NPDC050421]|uniref:FUSC family protein n=1 Tax=Streptomyces sp. NPDC050421 TaxID=3365613 RepID=UPI0037B15148